MKNPYIKTFVRAPENFYVSYFKMKGVGVYGEFYARDLNYLESRKLRLPFELLRKATFNHNDDDVIRTFLDNEGHVRFAFSRSCHRIAFDTLIFRCEYQNEEM